jgi:hypothetical protein
MRASKARELSANGAGSGEGGGKKGTKTSLHDRQGLYRLIGLKQAHG